MGMFDAIGKLARTIVGRGGARSLTEAEKIATGDFIKNALSHPDDIGRIKVSMSDLGLGEATKLAEQGAGNAVGRFTEAGKNVSSNIIQK